MRFLMFISGTLLASLTCNSQNNDYEKITTDTDTPTEEFKSIFSDESESLYDLIQCELRTKLENSQLAARKSKIVPQKQSVNELATIFDTSKVICNDANSNSTDDEKLEKRSRKLSLDKVELYENGEENKLRCEHEDDEKQKMDDTVIIDNKTTDTDNKLDNGLTSQIEQSQDQPISFDSTDRLHNQKQIKKIRKPNIIISPQSRKILNNDRRSVDDDFTDSDDSATWFASGEPTPRPVIKTQFHFDLQSIKDPQIRDMPIAKYKKRTLISRFRNINAPRLPNPRKNILNACNNIVRYSRNKLNRMVRKFRRPTIEPKRQFTAKNITKDDIVYILNIEPETSENAAASCVITSSKEKQVASKCVDIDSENDESEQCIENNK